jgi:DivIVA domain-containing protein
MWFFALVIVLLIGAVAVVASGRWGSMNEVYDDRPDMTVPSGHPLTAEDIRLSRFAVGVRGYRMDEVDTLLDRLADEVSERDRRIAELERATAQPPDPDIPSDYTATPPDYTAAPSDYTAAPPDDAIPPPGHAAPPEHAVPPPDQAVGPPRHSAAPDDHAVPPPERAVPPPERAVAPKRAVPPTAGGGDPAGRAEAEAETGWFRVEDENADRPV